MARLLPERPPRPASPALLKVLRLVRELPEGWVAWQNLAESPDADLWVLREADLRSAFLCVSAAGEVAARGPGLFDVPDPDAPPFGAAEEARRTRAEAGGDPGVPARLLFPEVPEDLLPRRFEAAGRETCRPGRFAEWLESRLGGPLDPADSARLRAHFCPETVVAAPPPVSGEAAPPTLLTWRQEEILKDDLPLDPEGRELSSDFGLLLVQGVAGSGKSLVLLHRARLLSRHFPRHRVLALTCNKPLQVELRRRYRALGGGPAEWRTFHALCRSLRPAGLPERPLARPSRRDEVLEALLPSLPRRLDRGQLAAEIAWLCDQGLPDEAAYQDSHRKGRGFRVDAALKSALWRSFLDYRSRLEADGLTDWGLLPLQVRDALREDPDPPRWDAILVDEAQFFPPVWFDTVRRILSPTGHLFLAADPSQGFLRRGTSWKSVGLSVQGRLRRLDRSHRTTRPVLELAWKCWNARGGADEPDALEPRLDGMPEGPAPDRARFPSAREEAAWIVRQARRWIEQGGSPADLLVLHEDWGAAQALLAELRDELGPEAAREAREEPLAPSARVCTLNAATGLESAVVFLAGAQRLFEREGSPLLDPEARTAARDDATRKLHMALTRAARRLVVTSTGRFPSELEPLLGP